MRITKRQLKKIIREVAFASKKPKRRLHEKYFGAESEDGMYEVSLTIDFDPATGAFDEKWTIRQDGKTVQEGDSFQSLKDYGNEDLDNELYGAISDVYSQVNDWV